MYISERLRNSGAHVPEIYIHDLDKDVYLQEDLGDLSLFQLTGELRTENDPSYMSWYEKVIEQMPAIQYHSAKDFDFSVCFPRAAFDRNSIMWDLNYFKYYYLKLAYIPVHEQELENDYAAFSDFLLTAPSDYFLFRDFQSRNIMIRNNEVYFIDYQGGRRGALQYDLASLLFEPKAGLTAEERQILLDHYLEVYSSYSFFDKDTFLKYFPAFVLVRMLQAFGAYGYRGYFERKPLFLQSIPPALSNLKWLLENYDLGVDLPHLRRALKIMVTLPGRSMPDLPRQTLTVSVSSFSYKKGMPDDYSGNGGGFVFDCRSLPNPGRFEQYKFLTGRDQAVIDFLEKEEEVKRFNNHVEGILDVTIENYLLRGFEHLMVSFGCTGGQHRSVFCADRLVKRLNEKFRINIRLHHRELEIEEP